MDEALLRDAELARDRLNEFEAQADRGRLELHQAIRRLHSAGRSMREIASALGLSHQRVHQIVSGGKPIAESARKSTLFNRLVRRNPKECEPGGESNWFDQIVGERLYIDAREALTLSQLEARALNHSYLGTEHLLLGLMRADIGLAPRLLRAIGADANRSRARIQNLLGTPPHTADRLSPTARLKEVLELASLEAKRLRSTHVRSEHLLLGLAREGRGLGARVLIALGITYDQIRSRVSWAAIDCSFCGRSGLEVAHLVAGPGVYICEHCVEEAGAATSPLATRQHAAPAMRLISKDDPDAACTFCGKRVANVDRLVGAGSRLSICIECLVLCREIDGIDL